jgi:hypothetical protein
MYFNVFIDNFVNFLMFLLPFPKLVRPADFFGTGYLEIDRSDGSLRTGSQLIASELNVTCAVLNGAWLVVWNIWIIFPYELWSILMVNNH